jgi:beta-galactosidase/beta-glucuronidase
MLFKKLISILFFCCCVSFAFAQTWTAKKGTLMTRFSKDVNPEKVLPEYPRPQMVRSEWLNLNGLWQYQPGIAENEKLPAGKLTGTILVPFPVESALSGVMEHHERLWYKRTFTIPANWRGQRVLLHFGAVDFESEVFINGKSVGIHKGGYDPFSYDITNQITKKGAQEIAVRVYDATDKAGNPRGKQSLPGGGIMYTSTTGIWQTVWLEPVAATYINAINLTPDIDESVLKLKINSNADGNAMAMISVKDGNKIVATLSGKATEEIIIPIPDQKLWSPENPFLYDITISLKKGKKTVDNIAGYFGMRKISVQEDGGFKKTFLNNKFVFQIGPLDQGFWPNGVYTAPTDEALRYDLEVIKKLGFNMVRKHIKVERMRWYYWADKLGVMVWQDMPSANSYSDKTPDVDTAEYARELTRLVQTHINSPSIIMWVLFNEGQGQNNTVKLVNMVHQLDASRLINQASGGGFFNVGDMLDIHSYPSPDYPKSETQAMACGEYGGIGYEIKNHVYKNGWGYQMVDNQKSYDSLYVQFANDLTAYKTSKGLSAAVYTQLTDVETELNGLMTYDRAVIKGDLSKIAEANRELIQENLQMLTVLPTSELTGRQWKYTTSIADSTSWSVMNFDDKNWTAGDAGFGTKSGRLEKIEELFGILMIFGFGRNFR